MKALELVAGIAHDLKTPLATITTSAELLEQEVDRTSSNYLINIIQRQAQRLQLMVQDLSEYFSLGCDRVLLHPETVNLTELVRDVCNDFQQFEDSHQLDVRLPASPMLLRVDSAKVRRILENLLSNAFKYSPKGSGVLASLSSFSGQVPSALIEVENEGTGIPLEDRSRIFEPFVRLQNQGEPGQGLGLNIVKLLAEAHGGRAWVEDGSLGGARFCVSLPLADRHDLL